MSQSAPATIPPAEDAAGTPRATTLSDGSQAIVRPNGQIISGYCEIEGRVSADGQRRRAEEHRTVVRAFKVEVAAKRITAARRRTPTTAPPRPRARQHRAVARRRRRLSRTSSRSADPGDDGDDGEPAARPPTRPVATFARLRRLTPAISGARREQLAHAFPTLARRIWAEVAERAGEEIDRALSIERGQR